MSTPVQRTATRQSVAALTQHRDRTRAGSPSGTPAERALLRIQSTAGNRAATAAVQRARGTAKEKAPQKGNASTGTKSYRDRIAAALDRVKKNLEFIDTFVKGVQVPANAGFSQQASATVSDGLKHSAGSSGAAAAGRTSSRRPPAPCSVA